MKILILGYGFVGKATHRLLTNIDESLDISIHDPENVFLRKLRSSG